MDEQDDYEEYPASVPRVFINGSHVVLRIDHDDFMFPYDIWDATVQYIKELRSGNEILKKGTLIKTLPKKITWEDKLPDA